MTGRVIILGGSEFVGGRFANWLREYSDKKSLLLDAASKRHLVAAKVDFVAIDVANAEQLAATIRGDDLVVNCVAGTATAMRQSASAIYAAVGQRGAKLIQLSTMAAYGTATGVVREDHPLLGDVDDYAAARAEIDRMAAQAGVVRLRPGIIYGPGSQRWSWQIGRLLMANRLGDLGVAGDGIANLLYIDDLLRVMQLAVEKPELFDGAMNLSGEAVTWNQYLVAYAKSLGATPVRRITQRALKWEVKLLAPSLKIAQLVARGKLDGFLPELLPPSMLRVFGQSIRLDVTKANQALGVSWTNVADGLKQSALWMQQALA